MHTRVVMLTLVVVSEIVGRLLFYASSVRLGPV
jgi:DMSO reductase anchor subunit